MPATRNRRKKTPGPGTARSIWLAGLGAIAVAEGGGGRTLRRLAQRGARMKREHRAAVRKVVARIARLRTLAGAELIRRVEPVAQKVHTATWELGIPGRREVLELTRRVEQLTAQLARVRARARGPVPRRRVPRPAHHGMVPA
jgi:poly(hydroxyalkanoate) granule-associated protein